MENLLVAQSGGPTAAINSTLSGIINYAYTSNKIDNIIGALNGIEGVIEERFVNINEFVRNSSDLDLLSYTPAAALGSCRYKMKSVEDDLEIYQHIIKVFRKNHIKYFIYIGGNDSMDTVSKLSYYCKNNNINDIRIIGAPKTIDNDLEVTDHCPGFGSAAKYIATTFSEIERDCRVYNKKAVTIVEVMGRNTGWLTAASALSRIAGGKGPDLIYLCEMTFDKESFIKDVREKLEEQNSVLVAVSEGIKDKYGQYVSYYTDQRAIDMFGHIYISGASKVLEKYLIDNIGCKTRSIELNLMQRCASHISSKTDLEESKMLGMKACQCAIEGESGVMSILIRKKNDPYEVEVASSPVDFICNKEKCVPKEWITKNNVTEDMIGYLLPLIQGENKIVFEQGVPKYFYFN